MLRGKIWGSTESLFNHNNVECHRIKIKAGYASSWHVHNSRQNEFYIISGKLVIQSHKNDYKLIDNTLLCDGDKTYVPVNERHRFIALTDVDALEWYWVNLNYDDIKRTDHGKQIPKNELSEIMKLVNYKPEL